MINQKIFYQDWQFCLGVQQFEQLPNKRNPEFAFIGASNVGKSSIVNAVLGKKLAITSSTPGRTRQLNFYSVDINNPHCPIIVDVPGYGYAKASKLEAFNWQKLTVQYLSSRQNLKRAFLLIDLQKGIKKDDKEMLNLLSAVAVSCQIIFTKTDKIKPQNLALLQKNIEKEVSIFPSIYPKK